MSHTDASKRRLPRIGGYGWAALILMVLSIAFFWVFQSIEVATRGGITLTALAIALGLAGLRAQQILAHSASTNVSEATIKDIARAVADELEARMRPVAQTLVFKPDASPRTTGKPTHPLSDASPVAPGTRHSGA